MATGLFVGGWITYILSEYYDKDWKDPERYAPIFGVYAAIGLIKAALTFLLTERCEADHVAEVDVRSMEQQQTTAPLLHGGRRNNYRNPAKDESTVRRMINTVTIRMSRESRGVLIRLSILFAVNSFASGLLPVTLMSWYVNYRYRWFLTWKIGYAMSAAWLLASFGHLFSASIARRIGLIRTMVFTHLPNAIFVGLIPFAEDWKMMLVLLLVSSVLGSMDQAPRTAFCAAMFSRSEFTAVMGTLNFVRTVASAGAPLLTGYFHDRKMWHATFWTAAALKVLYDFGLLAMFLNTKVPEHKRGPRELTVADLDVEILLSENMRHPEEFENLEEDEDGDLGGYHTTGRGKYEPIQHVEDA